MLPANAWTMPGPLGIWVFYHAPNVQLSDYESTVVTVCQLSDPENALGQPRPPHRKGVSGPTLGERTGREGGVWDGTGRTDLHTQGTGWRGEVISAEDVGCTL